MPDQESIGLGNVSEVWVVVRPDGGLVPPLDDDGTRSFLAWPTKDEAIKGLAHQQKVYELEGCYVARLNLNLP